MDLQIWMVFVGTVAIIAFSPGPSVLLVTAQRIRHGNRAAAATIAGDLTANMLQMTAAGVGLAVVVQTSALFFVVLKWVGVAYLLYLGLMRIVGSVSYPMPRQNDGTQLPEGNSRAFRRGFLVSAANPKAVVFFASFFPLFLSPGVELAPQLLILGSTFVVLDALALSIYSHFGSSLHQWLRSRGREHWEGRITGGFLIGAGVALAAKR